ncbi:MAG: hypothetical protein J7641_01355 [Cyanobacteria bacterium SID2]|nr:hypothetical protein [Cyanobacteria bacterium SID2]MBP0005757.1 hypothetical protein [Cyanobacteria bacterium SBC]
MFKFVLLHVSTLAIAGTIFLNAPQVRSHTATDKTDTLREHLVTHHHGQPHRGGHGGNCPH